MILATLIGQGAVLPRLIVRLGLAEAGVAEAAEDKQHEVAARVEGVKAVLARLEELAGEDTPDAAIAALRRRHEDRLTALAGTADEHVSGSPVVDNAVIQLQLIDTERSALANRYAEGALTDEARRRIERELDLEDARVRHAAESAVGDWINADPAAEAEATGPEGA